MYHAIPTIPHTPHRQRAFALPELIAIVALALIAIALLAVTADRQRRNAGLTQSLANLRQIAAWTGSYAADNDDRYWGFSWKQGDANLSSYSDLRGPFFSDLTAMSAQAIDILRRRTGSSFTLPTAWMPVTGYSHLPLADYAALPLPELTFISPGDLPRAQWARDPAGFMAGNYPPQPAPDLSNAYIPYQASYEVMPTFFQSDSVDAPWALSQGSSQRTFSTNSAGAMRQRRLVDVAFPANKVHLAESAQRYFGSADVYFLFTEARVPVLAADGAASVRATRESNSGWNPAMPTRAFPMVFSYLPTAWEPPVPTGASERIEGRYRWTRLGLRGRDFDGPEVFP